MSEFYLTGVSMDRCQLLWLLPSGKVVQCKAEIPISDLLILKERERYLQMKVVKVTKSMVEIKSVLGLEEVAYWERK